MILTATALHSLREACRQIGESEVTLATSSGVVTFRFEENDCVSICPLKPETQPTRQQLEALLATQQLATQH